MNIRVLSVLAIAFALASPSARAQQSAAKPAAKPAAASAAASAAPSAPAAAANAPTDEPTLTPDEEAKLKSALAAFNKQNVSEALSLLREICATNPAARPPRVVVANWFIELKNVKAASASLEMATEEDPNDPEAYYALAELALKEGALTSAELLTLRGDQALKTYSSNAKRVKSMTRSSYALKVAYASARQRWDEAQRALLGLMKTDGETAELDRAYARALFQQKQDEKARQTFLRADALDKGAGLPADAEMAKLYASRGDLASAKTSLEAALTANPKSTPVLLLSISMALAENDLATAQQLVDRLYKEDKSVEVLKTYGKVALFRSDYRNAEAAFQEAVRQSPLDVDAVGGLALALCEQGDAEKNKRATQYAASNLQKQGNNRDFLATLGWTLYKSGQKDEALKVLQQSAADGQLNAASAYYLAVALNDRGQTDAARQLLLAAVGTQPPFAKRAEAEKLLKELQTSAQTAPDAPQGSNLAQERPAAVASNPAAKPSTSPNVKANATATRADAPKTATAPTVNRKR